MTIRGLQSSSRNPMERSGQTRRARRASCRCRQKPYCGEMLLRPPMDLVEGLQQQAAEGEKLEQFCHLLLRRKGGDLISV